MAAEEFLNLFRRRVLGNHPDRQVGKSILPSQSMSIVTGMSTIRYDVAVVPFAND